MTTQTGEPRVGPRDNWEPPVWMLLLLATAITRLFDLGARVMSHDESIHAFSSFTLYAKGLYRHDPAFHGPLLYYGNALIYYFFGDSDVTARLVPALIGIAVLPVLWMFRRYLGRTAVAWAAGLLVISPTFLFYSRYIREDIYIVLFTLLWIYGAFRYLDERRPQSLGLVSIAMALSFITKESSFIFGAMIGSFFAVRACWRSSSADPDGHVSRASGDLAVLMLTLVLPFLSGPAYLALDWSPLDRAPAGDRLAAAAGLLAGLMIASAAIGLTWFSRKASADRAVGAGTWTRLFVLFWAFQAVFFTGFFTNTIGGLTTGIAGSLGYWLGQHDVARGSQPWFYYFILGTLYEFLALAAGGVGAVILGLRLRQRDFDPVPAGDLPAERVPSTVGTRRLFALFVLWWGLASWVAYAWAGERMPWLLAHQILPVILFAGWALARLAGGLAAGRLATTAVLAAGTAIALVLLFAVLRTNPLAARDITSVASTVDWWVRVLLLAVLLPVLASIAARTGKAQAARAAALGLLSVLGVHTLRTGIQLTYVNYDLPTELMSYAQASPDIKRVMRTIEAIAERTTGPHQVEVAYDDESTWPLLWYLRNYPNARTWGTDPRHVRAAPIVLTGDKNMAALRPYVERGFTAQRHVIYWWPLQDYAKVTPSGFLASLRDPSFRSFLWRVFTRRDFGVPLAAWPLRREMQMFLRNDIAGMAVGMTHPGRSVLPNAAAAPVSSVAPEAVFAGPFAGLPLRGPTSVTVSLDGRWIVADGGNHRILILGTDGSLLQAIGSRCSLTEEGQPGCADPDGGGPLAAGDGQFNEPWGVAAGPDGELFVSDTWNGRVQSFDRHGAFRRKWGRFDQHTGSSAGSEVSLYGPRGMIVDHSGDLVVADTGNKRLMIFGTSGEVRGIIGSSSDVPEFFNEPSALARDGNGTLLVADAWNGRIVRLDNRRQTIGAWQVPGWSSRAAEDKPAVAVDAAGFVYASDPGSGRVFVFTASGRLETTLQIPSGSGAARPTGLAVDAGRKKLLVLDHAGGRLLVFGLYERPR